MHPMEESRTFASADLFFQYFERVCRSNPEAPAIVQPDGITSYSQLLSAARRCASYLKASGAARGDLIALGLPKCAELLAYMLGAWAAGLSFVTLDLDNPTSRMQFMLEDSGATLVVCSERDRKRFSLLHSNVIAAEEMSHYEGAIEKAALSGEDIAYVFYTSGSSGRPKGVPIPHRALVPMLREQIAMFGTKEDSRVLWWISTAFDASISDLGTALLSGAALVIEEKKNLQLPELYRTFEKHRITHLDIAPAVLSLMDPSDATETLQTIVIGGEVTPLETVRRWAAKVRLINVYGPTEATICTSMVKCDEHWARPLIGSPLSFVKYHVLDEDQNPVARGIQGELCIESPGLAPHYLNLPDLTAVKFGLFEGRRIYRTGDAVLQHPDGAIEFRGRYDRQFKVNGALVEPLEVEMALESQEAIIRASVMKVRGRLVAAYVSRSAAASSEEQIRTKLRERLPERMVPQILVALESLPLNANGKVDYGALDSLLQERLAARTGLAEGLAAEWQRVTGSLEANFFASGASSLEALRFVVLANDAGHKLTMEVLQTAATYHDALDRESSRVDVRIPETDLRREEVVPIPIAGALGGRPRHRAPPLNVLLTGGTGLLGSQILRRILDSGLSVFSLEREPRALPAERNITVIRGDLAQTGCGLTQDVRDIVSRSVDAIIHCGARVNFAEPYEALLATNVTATSELLKLAHETFPYKAFHYISTRSVENSENSSPFQNGYAESKRIAELLVRRVAGQAGYSPSIFRPGYIAPAMGDVSVSRRYLKSDLVGSYIRAMLTLRSYPRELEAHRVQVTDAGKVAEKVVAQVIAPSDDWHVSTIAPSEFVSAKLLALCAKDAGISLTPKSLPLFLAELHETAASADDEGFYALYVALSALSDDSKTQKSSVLFESQEAPGMRPAEALLSALIQCFRES